jgi:hypothetical protein
MELGSIQPGVVQTLRYFRGSKIVQNKFGEIVAERSPKGGITFFFQLDYNANILSFTAAIAREDQPFNYAAGREECELNILEATALAHASSAVRSVYTSLTGVSEPRVFFFDLDPNEALIDQVHSHLTKLKNLGQLKHDFLRTLLKRMNEYDKQNADTEDFVEEQEELLAGFQSTNAGPRGTEVCIGFGPEGAIMVPAGSIKEPANETTMNPGYLGLHNAA